MQIEKQNYMKAILDIMNDIPQDISVKHNTEFSNIINSFEEEKYQNCVETIDLLKKRIAFSQHKNLDAIGVEIAKYNFFTKVLLKTTKENTFLIDTDPLHGVEIKFNSILMQEDNTVTVEFDYINGEEQGSLFPELMTIAIEAIVAPVVDKAIKRAENNENRKITE